MCSSVNIFLNCGQLSQEHTNIKQVNFLLSSTDFKGLNDLADLRSLSHLKYNI